MRVLVLSQQMAAFRSGVGTYAAALVTGLVQRGHAVTAVVPAGEGVDLPGVRCLTVPRSRFDPTPGSWRRLAGEFSRIVERLASEHDVVHFTDAREALRLERPAVPVVGMVNDSYALDWVAGDYPRHLFADRLLRSLYYRYLRRVERRTYQRLAGLLANSRQVAGIVTAG